ncbi:MAG TPA: TraR/DksA C4-type zinc finger protein [Bacillaceae bacterium]
MLTKQQLSHLKQELLLQREQLDRQVSQEVEGLQEDSQRDNVGELSMYDNHPADMGTELFEREKDFALSTHAESELNKVDQALQAIENGTYGKCQECGKEIPYERLEAIPNTTFCIDHTPERDLPTDRPVEEEILEPARDDSFAGRHDGKVKDYNDSFQEVAHFGTSETPSDFEGDFDHYSELYDEDTEEGFAEEYESFAATDIEGKNRQAIQSNKEREYAETLEDEGIDAPFGDLPYKRSDGYVEDDDK